jgi:hypothetical protein
VGCCHPVRNPCHLNHLNHLAPPLQMVEMGATPSPHPSKSYPPYGGLPPCPPCDSRPKPKIWGTLWARPQRVPSCRSCASCASPEGGARSGVVEASAKARVRCDTSQTLRNSCRLNPPSAAEALVRGTEHGGESPPRYNSSP